MSLDIEVLETSAGESPGLDVAADHRAADLRAAACWAANLRALACAQPSIVQQVQSLPARVNWIFARDGYLTAQQSGAWWSGCSAPLRAAQYMLRIVDGGGSVACLLNPAHAAQVRTVLEVLARPQAIIVLLPDLHALRVLLACDDFSEEIVNHRLWFASGSKWEVELQQMLERNIGLPTPAQFVRPTTPDQTLADSLVAPAQRVFAQINMQRNAAVQSLVVSKKARLADRRRCVIAPSHFRLWDDAGALLARSILSDPKTPPSAVICFDPDDPSCASPLALATAASECTEVWTANVGRSDLPQVAAIDLPWTTWITLPRIPAAGQRGPNDRLLVVDDSLRMAAISAGWPSETISALPWPHVDLPVVPDAARKTIAFVADLPAIDPPKHLAEYSSLTLLWDSISHELCDQPLALQNPQAYLDERLRRQQIPAHRFNHAEFVEGVIVPSFQRGLARLLMRAGVQVRLYGSGWSDLEEFAAVSAGPLRSRDALLDAAASSAALVHCWPTEHWHPIQAIGRPVIRPFGKNRQTLIRDAQAALASKR